MIDIIISGITARDAVGPWLNGLGLVDEAVEVGTHRGEFARTLLSTWQGRMLHCIDPYTSGYCPGDPLSSPERDRAADRAACWKILAEFPGRVTLYIGRSVNAARLFPHDDARLDFVYVDGDHGYDAVFRDLAMWWPRLHAGGILMGHDYDIPGQAPYPWITGVKPAVHKFAEQYRQPIHLIVEATVGFPSSYYFVKPGCSPAPLEREECHP